MRVLVTGSTGFIGSHLCRALVKAGHRVRAFHRPGSPLSLLSGIEVEHAPGDLTSPETIQAAMENIEVVFHAGAFLGGQGQPGQIYATTVEGTRSVLQAARQAGVKKVIHTSSVAALGVPDNINDLALLDEHHTWNYPPDYWPYGYAKYLAELEVQKAVALGMHAVILNPTTVFGPGDLYRQGSSLVVQVANRQLPFMTTGGMNVVHIDDVIAGHLAALERGANGQRYILGGQNITHVALVSRIAEITGQAAPALVLPPGLIRRLVQPIRLLRPFVHLPVDASMLRLAGYYFYYDLRKAREKLGLGPPKALDISLQEAWEWFRGAGAVV
jgi:dihydroflavonol-4-reductase